MNKLFKDIWFQIIINNIVALWAGSAVAMCPDVFPGKDNSVKPAKTQYDTGGTQKSFEENQKIQQNQEIKKYRAELAKLDADYKDVRDDILLGTLIKLHQKSTLNNSKSVTQKYPNTNSFVKDNKDIFEDMIKQIHEYLVQKQVVFGHLVKKYRRQDGPLNFIKDHEPYFNHLLDILYGHLSDLTQMQNNSMPEHEVKKNLAKLISETNG